MTKKTTNYPEGLPTKEVLHQYILDNPDDLDKREIARAFGIKGQDRTKLRIMLREMTEDGMLAKSPRKAYGAPERLSDTTLIEILDLDGDGELRAKPVEWFGKGVMPIIYVTDKKRSGAGLKKGDQVLAKLRKIDRHEYEARVLKAKDAEENPHIVGVFKSYRGGGYVTPTDKKNKEEYFVPEEYCAGATDGDLVVIELIPPRRDLPKSKNPSRVVEKIGDKDDPRFISLIAIHAQGIPTKFSKDTLREAESFSEPTLGDGREDLRDIPLVTIDGADARDFDDAVFAEPAEDGGWHLVVAIADVSFYVRPGSALDKDAFDRGNSTYFADRVVPMLPERLSNDLCSLRPKVNRACLAVHMTIDKNAKLLKYKFVRGLMRSAARLTYEQVEDAHRGAPDDMTASLMDTVINPLYKAYGVLKKARQDRGALELDLPERKAVIEDGIIKAIIPRQRLDSHQLIEEFMILANVAAAMELERKNAPCLYRIHDQPSYERIEAARDFLKEMGYSLPKSDDLQPKNLNHLLKLSTERGEAGIVHTLLLRTQSQAIYHPDNIGHFGLALEKYAHFTSPIRRYADLIVHRSLVKSGALGDGGITEYEAQNMHDIADHISFTERRSMLAERDVMDRFTAQYLQSRIGDLFKAHISSVTHFGMFVTLDETGADGIVPMRQLPSDYYVHDEARHRLVGKNSGRSYGLADAVIVRLLEADPMRASTVFQVVDGADDNTPTRKPHHNERRPFGKKKKDKGFRRDDERGNGGKNRGKNRGKKRRK